MYKTKVWLRVSLILVVLVLFSGELIANSSFFTTQDLDNKLINKTVILLACDVEIYRLSNIEGKNTDSRWTQQAKQNFLNGITDIFDGSQFKYKPKPSLIDRQLVELVANQRIIEKSILSHFQFPLPSKKDFNWSTGNDSDLIKRMVDAEYGLFVLFKGGFPVDSSNVSYQFGQASLVDLNTGRTVWFNAGNNLPGDLRDPNDSLQAIRNIFNRLPQ